MGMTNDEIIQGIQVIKAQAEWDYPLDWQIVLDTAIETMRKYQKIKEQVDIAIDTENFAISGARLIQIREIINGNDD